MAIKKRKGTNRIRRAPKITGCFYCENDTNPNYLNFEELNRFISDRAKIASKEFSGLCAKHQRRMSVSIKRSRHLGLLPFQARA